MPTPQSQLHDLLLSLFSADELRRWIRHDAALVEIASSLPGSTASAAHVVDDAIAAMRSRGLIDAAFFTRLQAEFPRRSPDIAPVARAWTSAEEGSAAANGPDASTRKPSPVNVYHGGVHISGHAQVSTQGDIVGGNRIENTDAGSKR